MTSFWRGTWARVKRANMGGAAMAAGRRASGVWGEEGNGNEGSPSADSFTAWDHTREREKEEDREKGKEEGIGTAAHSYLRRPNHRRFTTGTTNTCDNGSIRVLRADDAN